MIRVSGDEGWVFLAGPGRRCKPSTAGYTASHPPSAFLAALVGLEIPVAPSHEADTVVPVVAKAEPWGCGRA